MTSTPDRCKLIWLLPLLLIAFALENWEIVTMLCLSLAWLWWELGRGQEAVISNRNN